jgi:hypothetical protein
MRPVYEYTPCQLQDLAAKAGKGLKQFHGLLSKQDLIELIKLGWRPHHRKLSAHMVKYLADRYVPTYFDSDG